jgi:hypothetical protein
MSIDLKNKLSNELRLASQDKQDILQLNRDFLKSGATINVYVKDHQFPVGVYKLPEIKEEVWNS